MFSVHNSNCTQNDQIKFHDILHKKYTYLRLYRLNKMKFDFFLTYFHTEK